MLPENQRLSLKLRQATKKVHSLAEQTNYIKGFLRGTADIDSYTQLLTDLQPIYIAMEDSICESRDGASALKEFYLPEIFRSEKLAQDIDYLKTLRTSNNRIRPSPASNIYEKRIKEVSSTSPAKLIGHIYTRYLGDLAGGQILARIASRSMGLSESGGGLDFYNFGGKEANKRLKLQLKSTIDAAGETLKENHTGITEEAVLAFQYNIRLFEMLEGSAWQSLIKNIPFLNSNFAPHPQSL